MIQDSVFKLKNQISVSTFKNSFFSFKVSVFRIKVTVFRYKFEGLSYFQSRSQFPDLRVQL